MIFWSDMTDRKSPVPSEAINISHLPRQSGRGGGGARKATVLSQGQSVQKPSGDSPSVGLREWEAGLAQKTTLWGGCGVGVGVGESLQRTKNLPLQTLRGCPATRLPNSQRTYALHTHSHPPERSMESREGAGAKKCRIKDTKHSPALPLPQAHRFI